MQKLTVLGYRIPVAFHSVLCEPSLIGATLAFAQVYGWDMKNVAFQPTGQV